jgi:hypothetical protein
MSVHNVDVKLIAVHTAEPLVPGPSRLEVDVADAKLKSINRLAVMISGRTDSSRKRNITVCHPQTH